MLGLILIICVRISLRRKSLPGGAPATKLFFRFKGRAHSTWARSHLGFGAEKSVIGWPLQFTGERNFKPDSSHSWNWAIDVNEGREWPYRENSYRPEKEEDVLFWKERAVLLNCFRLCEIKYLEEIFSYVCSFMAFLRILLLKMTVFLTLYGSQRLMSKVFEKCCLFKNA